MRPLATVLLSVVPHLAPAATIHVPGDQPTIQAGINAAQEGDVIEVAPGVYHEALVLPTGLTLTSSAGPAVTAIDGDGVNRVITVPGGAPGIVEISGFTIQNAYAAQHGAGILVTDAIPTIANNVFLANRADGYGAAIYAFGCQISVTGNRFLGCHALEGAGIYLKNGVGTIRENDFRDGVGDRHCGGIYLYSSSPVIDRNLFVNCSAGRHGGGIDIAVFSMPTITNNTIVACSAAQGGGVMFANEGGMIQFLNNIVVGCTAGYGLYFLGSGAPPPYLECNDVWGNLPGDYYALEPGRDDISADPLFCDPPAGDYGLMDASPCAPAQQPTCGLIGALDVGCGATAAEPSTWGLVKQRFEARGR
jgi:hypothetical protein